MTTQILSYQDVLAAARWAYEGGNLQAQCGYPVQGCLYRTPDGHMCGVGAGLSEETIAKFQGSAVVEDNAMGVEVLARRGLVVFLSSDEGKALADLQQAHDNWAASFTTTMRQASHDYFVDLIYQP